MITIYIKTQQFFKNVDENGSIFTVNNKDIYLENGFKEILLDEQYKDCKYQDFNEDFTFNIEKYNTRKKKELATIRITELKQLLKDYDYIGTKIATGRATKEEYSTQIAQMTEWADEINRLEANL